MGPGSAWCWSHEADTGRCWLGPMERATRDQGRGNHASRAGRRPRPPTRGPATVGCQARRPAEPSRRGTHGTPADVPASAAAFAALAAAHRGLGRGGAGRWGLVGAVAWSEDRPARGTRTAGVSAATQRPTVTIAGSMASAGCKTAIDRANAELAAAVNLRRAAVAQGRILRDPANRDLTVREVLKKLAVSEQAGSRGVSQVQPRPGRLSAGRGPVQAASPLTQPGRSALHGGEDDHIRPVVPGGVVELPAAGHQPQRRGQGGVVHGIGREPVLGVLLDPLDHEPDR